MTGIAETALHFVSDISIHGLIIIPFPSRCVGNATCVEGPLAPQPPTLPVPFDEFGPIGFCQ